MSSWISDMIKWGFFFWKYFLQDASAALILEK